MRAVLVVAVVGCAADPEPVTVVQEPPFEYGIYAFYCENRQPPGPARPTIWVDGQAREGVIQTFDSVADARTVEHVIELRYGDLVVRSMKYGIAAESCVHKGVGLTKYVQAIAAYSNGDLRFAFGDTSGGTGGCAEDGPGFSDCVLDGCIEPTATTRCTSIVTSTAPFASYLACGPIGSRSEGQACRLHASARGFEDDCGAELVCLDGVCRHWEYGWPGLPDERCTPVPGHAPEVQLCDAL